MDNKLIASELLRIARNLQAVDEEEIPAGESKPEPVEEEPVDDGKIDPKLVEKLKGVKKSMASIEFWMNEVWDAMKGVEDVKSDEVEKFLKGVRWDAREMVEKAKAVYAMVVKIHQDVKE